MMLDSVLTILAGGSSRRFQLENRQWQDKTLLKINQTSILVHLLERSSLHYQDFCISVNSSQRQKRYLRVLKHHISLKKPNFIIDNQNSQFRGVFLGIHSVLSNYNNRNVQFIPSDRPYLDFQILSKMKTEKSGVSVLQYENGMIEPLLSLYGSDVCFPKEFEKLPLTRADVLIRLLPNLQVYNATSILEKNDLPSYIFDNINVHSDFVTSKEIVSNTDELKIPPPIKIMRNKISDLDSSIDVKDYLEKLMENDNFYLAFLWCRYFTKDSLKENKEISNIGKEGLKKEHNYWLDNNMPFLALHALQDLIHFFPEEENTEITHNIAQLKTELKIKSKRM